MLKEVSNINVGNDHKSIVLSFGKTERGVMAHDWFNEESHRDALKGVIGELTGKSVEITCQMNGDGEEKDITSLNLTKVNFDIVIE